jgi:hypothetical protein
MTQVTALLKEASKLDLPERAELVSSTPFSPPSGLATGSLNGLNPKSKFLAI